MHTHYELLHIAVGRMDMYFEDMCLPLEGGGIVLIPPGVCHKAETVTDELVYQNAQFYYKRLDSPVCAGLYRYFDALLSGNGVICLTATDAVQAQFHDLAALGRRDSAYESLLFMARFAALMLAIGDELSPIPKNFCTERVVVDNNALNIRYEISTYLNHCYKRNPSLGELAAGLHMSERQAARQIREMYGKSFMEYVTQMRMLSARHELLHTEYSVCEIAEHVGYPSIKNFFYAFKKYYGSTPEQYRKRFGAE